MVSNDNGSTHLIRDKTTASIQKLWCHPWKCSPHTTWDKCLAFHLRQAQITNLVQKQKWKNNSINLLLKTKYRILKLNITCRDLQIICINAIVDLKFGIKSWLIIIHGGSKFRNYRWSFGNGVLFPMANANFHFRYGSISIWVCDNFYNDKSRGFWNSGLTTDTIIISAIANN